MTQFETESLPMTHLPTDEMNHWVTKSSGRLTTAFDTVHWTSQHLILEFALRRFFPLRTLGRRFRTRTRQRRPNTPARFGNEQSVSIRILINYACAVLKKTACIGSRAVRTVEFVAKHTQIGRELAAVMGGMGDAAHQNPGSAPVDIEKLRGVLEPGFGLRLQPAHSG